MKLPLSLLGISCLVLISGCTHTVVLEPTSNIDDRIRAFHGSNSVALINGQPSTEPQLIMKNGVHSFYGNLRQATDTAITITARELTKRGLHIVSNSGKRVTLAIESIHTDVGMWTIETKVVLKVQTSDGFSATYTGTNTAGMTIVSHHMNEVVAYAVAEMLSDQRFIAVVTK